MAKVFLQYYEHVLVEPKGTQAQGGARQLYGIDVNSVQPPPRLNALDQSLRVTTISERGVQSSLARTGIQYRQDFIDTDGSVHAGRCLAPLHDLRDFMGMLLAGRVKLLVLLFELAGVSPGVTYSALVLWGSICHWPLSILYQRSGNAHVQYQLPLSAISSLVITKSLAIATDMETIAGPMNNPTGPISWSPPMSPNKTR